MTAPTKVPTQQLLSKEFALQRGKLMEAGKAIAYPGWGELPSVTTAKLEMAKTPAFNDDYEIERDTTSFSIVDPFGNAVAGTPTIGGGFGNGVVVGNTGLLLNNGMRLGSTFRLTRTM